MAPILTGCQYLYPRADSVHDPAVSISLIITWLIISMCICPCFFGKHACQPEVWNACCGEIGNCCCAYRPKPEDVARERDLFAEDRIREKLRSRDKSREEGMVYQTPAEGLEADRSVVDIDVAQEEEQPQYKVEDGDERVGKAERRDCGRRTNKELAASDEREMPIDDQPRPYDDIMIPEPPPTYVEPRTEILWMNNER